MIKTIQNKKITLAVDSLGAQIMSLRGNDGTEYIWQGNPEYWSDRALNLFPYIGRLTNDSCKVHGKTYPMTIHGFACNSEFCCVENTETSLTMELTQNEETLSRYPFSFVFRIRYELSEDTVIVTFSVENRSEETMPFGLGGHPGFNVPLCKGEKFEDYSLTFTEQCCPDRVGFNEDVFLNGRDEAFLLTDNRRLELKHSLFDNDAIILKNMATEITLCGKSGRGVTVSYPMMSYLGIWHWPHKDAPYVCIEPWTSLPSREGVVEELSCKSDLVRLPAGEKYENTWTIKVF